MISSKSDQSGQHYRTSSSSSTAAQRCQQFPPGPKSLAKLTGSGARTAGIGSKSRRGAAPRGASGNCWLASWTLASPGACIQGPSAFVSQAGHRRRVSGADPPPRRAPARVGEALARAPRCGDSALPRARLRSRPASRASRHTPRPGVRGALRDPGGTAARGRAGRLPHRTPGVLVPRSPRHSGHPHPAPRIRRDR